MISTYILTNGLGKVLTGLNRRGAVCRGWGTHSIVITPHRIYSILCALPRYSYLTSKSASCNNEDEHIYKHNHQRDLNYEICVFIFLLNSTIILKMESNIRRKKQKIKYIVISSSF